MRAFLSFGEFHPAWLWLQVIIDYKEWQRMKKDEREPVCDTGSWSMIYKVRADCKEWQKNEEDN